MCLWGRGTHPGVTVPLWWLDLGSNAFPLAWAYQHCDSTVTNAKSHSEACIVSALACEEDLPRRSTSINLQGASLEFFHVIESNHYSIQLNVFVFCNFFPCSELFSESLVQLTL